VNVVATTVGYTTCRGSYTKRRTTEIEMDQSHLNCVTATTKWPRNPKIIVYIVLPFFFLLVTRVQYNLSKKTLICVPSISSLLPLSTRAVDGASASPRDHGRARCARRQGVDGNQKEDQAETQSCYIIDSKMECHHQGRAVGPGRDAELLHHRFQNGMLRLRMLQEAPSNKGLRN
jgi:hypothetical protein